MSKPKKSATPIDIEQLARDKINNKYAIVKLGELTFEPCDIIEELDLIAWHIFKLECYNELLESGKVFEHDNELYWKDDIEFKYNN